MSESRNISELPEGIIPEEDIKEEEKIYRRLMEIPGVPESIERLQSVLLSERYRYYSQADVIINCLREVFGDYDEKLLNITNDFLYRIGDFMDAYKALEEGSDDPEKQKKIERHYKSKKTSIRSYLSDYGKKYIDKFEQDNSDLSEDRVLSEISNKFDEFIDLLIQNLEYVPPKEGNE